VTTGRVTVLLTSPRVAPGLLGWPAWELLRRADRVLTGEPDHPQAGSLRAVGVAVEVVDSSGGTDDLARRLLDEATAGLELVWLATGGEADLRRALAGQLAARREKTTTGVPELTVMTASHDLPGARLLDLVSVMDQLRARCPWVQEQTPRSLVRYLVEEAYETVEAIESGDRTHLREELGDLLFQVVFHARLAEEGGDGGSGAWTIDDVAGDLVDKLVRRNPHVFGTATAGDAAEVENVWDQLKAEEKRRTSAVEGVPLALPALTLADKLLGRTTRSGLDVRVPASDVAGPDHLTADQLGDALLALADRARESGLDPEQALRDACRRYIADVHAAETR
jgi:XTP/dITP diphosphohydrolase